MKRALTLILLSLLFCGIEGWSQNRNYNYYALKPFDWSMHRNGPYQFQYMRKTNQGDPVHFVLVNTQTQKHLFPYYINKKGEKELKKQVGNYELVLWKACIFLKSTDGYAPCFDGLVWIVPDDNGIGLKCVTEGKLTYGAPRPSGIYRIENDHLTPILFDWESPIYPLGSLPYIAQYKNGRTTLYDAQFQPVKTIAGEVTADLRFVYITKPDGTKEVLDQDFTQLKQLPSDWRELYQYIENRIVWISRDKQSVKVFDEQLNLLWEESDQRVILCHGKGVYENYLRIGPSSQQGIRLLDGTWAIPATSLAPSDEEISRCQKWSYRQFVADFATQKGEFETTSHFNERQTNPALQETYMSETDLPKLFFSKFPGYALTLSPYNADAQTFTLFPNVALWNSLTIHIPLDEAEAFKKAFVELKGDAITNAEFCIRGDSIAIKKITVTIPDSRTYSFEF